MSTVYNKYVVGPRKGSQEDLHLFFSLEQYPERFHHNGKLATKDETGVYTCYYLLDYRLYTGTTREKPIQGSVKGNIIEYNGKALPETVDIPVYADNVFWIIHVPKRKAMS